MKQINRTRSKKKKIVYRLI